MAVPYLSTELPESAESPLAEYGDDKCDAHLFVGFSVRFEYSDGMFGQARKIGGCLLFSGEPKR